MSDSLVEIVKSTGYSVYARTLLHKRKKIKDKKLFYNNMRSNHESIKYYLRV